ncbi:NAD+ diphosphatase [Lachnospiraceae bacterium]|nr:NAD+ diphosphatase [Lachnospiraceae bacterium]
MLHEIAPHALNNQYDPDAVIDQDSILFFFRGRELLCRREDDEILLPHASDFPEIKEAVYLFEFDGKHCFMPLDTPDAGNGFAYRDIWVIRKTGGAPKHFMFMAVTAYQLSHWYSVHRFCGSCGTETRRSGKERAIVCPNCGQREYPKIAPAVVVAIIDTETDKILLTKYAGSRGAYPYYALVAGFTEIGETLEETAIREVREETGLEITDIRYYKSQPWGIVDDLMIGFFCHVKGSREIHMDASELKEAVWLSREEVIPQPDDFSLTNEMMCLFKDGKEPK